MLACRHNFTYSSQQIVETLLKCPDINVNLQNKKDGQL